MSARTKATKRTAGSASRRWISSSMPSAAAGRGWLVRSQRSPAAAPAAPSRLRQTRRPRRNIPQIANRILPPRGRHARHLRGHQPRAVEFARSRLLFGPRVDGPGRSVVDFGKPTDRSCVYVDMRRIASIVFYPCPAVPAGGIRLLDSQLLPPGMDRLAIRFVVPPFTLGSYPGVDWLR